MSLETARQPGISSGTDRPRPPFAGKRRLVNTVAVRFENVMTAAPCDCGDLVLRSGDNVVVASDKGPMIGRVSGLRERRVLGLHEIKRVLRQADAADMEQWRQVGEESERVHRTCVQALRRTRNTAMKIVAVEIPLDRSKVMVIYSSEERTDIRGFVRAVAPSVDGRLEMKQLNIRDGAGVIGGIGPCGNEVCCSTFLTNFSSISIRFAKDQGLSLNPQRIMGMCGRLKCCLVYEQPVYKEMRRYAPRRKNGAITPNGHGNILEVDTLARKVSVRLQHSTESFHMRDVVVLDQPLSWEEIQASAGSKEESVLAARRSRRGGTSDSRKGMTRQAASVLQEEYLWDDMASEAKIEDTPTTKAGDRPKRSRGGSDSSKSGGGTGEKSGRRRSGAGRGGAKASAGAGASSGSSRRRRGGQGDKNDNSPAASNTPAANNAPNTQQ
ncbi:MAG: cell fate regulator YaaT (PSP1 superfamily), partial [Flavobacteriales bacterium]